MNNHEDHFDSSTLTAESLAESLPPLPALEAMTERVEVWGLMKDYALAAIQRERERIAESVWPQLPAIKCWSDEETEAMVDADKRATERGKGYFESLFAVASAALKIRAAAIRKG